MATFRNRCKELAREILKTEYRAAIFPDQAQYRGRDEWTEKVKSNVEKLLDGSTYHEHGVDAQVSFKTNDLHGLNCFCRDDRII